ncbi:MAG: glycosyltransferase family 39 protein [Elusimicrobiota bacterium]|jgi:4-amino-4-deoxy-L-arabinose transferase-like glycosyltransferase
MFVIRSAITLGWLALVLWSAGGYGAFLGRFLAFSVLGPGEQVVMSLSLGLGLFSHLMILAGLCQAWTFPGVCLLLIPGLLMSHPFWISCRRLKPSHPSIEKTSIAARGLILLGSVLALVVALAPTTYYDSLVYHLALPAEYVKAGHWVGLPNLIYSAFPQTLEMLWTAGLLLGGDALVNVLALSLGALALAALILFGRRFLNPRSALWAGALLSVMPAFLLLSSGGYVDVGLMLFSFLSFYALQLWAQKKQPPLLILSGVMAGLAMGCKYTGAIPAAIVVIFIFKESWGSPSKVLLSRLTLYGLTACATVSPWLIKNIIYVGNPVFPFFYAWGSTKLNPWVQSAAAGYFRGLTEYQPYSLTHLARLVWEITVNGLRYGGGMDVLGDFGWMPLVALLPALTLCRQRGKILSDSGLFVLLFFIPWGMSRPVLRFLMPVAPLLALLAGHAWAEGVERLPAPFRWTCRTLLTLMLVSGFCVFFTLTTVFSPFGVALGLEDRSAYLRRKLDYFAAASFVNQLPGATRLLVVGDQRGYYYEKPTGITPVFNENPLASWANAAADAEALRDRIRAQGYSHLVVNHKEMKRLEAYHLFPFSAAGQRNWDHFLSRVGKRLYQDPACEVFEL